MSDRPADREAWALLAALGAGRTVDPRLVTLLLGKLREQPAEPVPEAMAEVAEWIGADDRERGRTLRELLQTGGRAEGSRPSDRPQSGLRFPRFSSRRSRSD